MKIVLLLICIAIANCSSVNETCYSNCRDAEVPHADCKNDCAIAKDVGELYTCGQVKQLYQSQECCGKEAATEMNSTVVPYSELERLQNELKVYTEPGLNNGSACEDNRFFFDPKKGKSCSDWGQDLTADFKPDCHPYDVAEDEYNAGENMFGLTEFDMNTIRDACPSTCNMCRSSDMSCGLTPEEPCDTCLDKRRVQKGGMFHIKGLGGVSNNAVYCDKDGWALMAVVKKVDCNAHFNTNQVAPNLGFTHGTLVQLQNGAHNMFVAMSASVAMGKSADAYSADTEFKVIDAGDGYFGLYNMAHKKFMCTGSGSYVESCSLPIYAELPDNARFLLVKNDHTVALWNNNRYVRMPSGNNLDYSGIHHDAINIPSGWVWEMFYVTVLQTPPVVPSSSSTVKYSDAIINQYRALSEAAGAEGTQQQYAFKMVASDMQITQYCSKQCLFNAQNSINAVNECNDCVKVETGSTCTSALSRPSVSVRGMGHGHNLMCGGFFAWQNDPQLCNANPLKCGCRRGFTATFAGPSGIVESDGTFWVK